MSFAQVAERAIQMGGEYDGHELPGDIHAQTRPAAEMLAGEGLMGVAKDNYGRTGSTYSFVAGFAMVELDHETGVVAIKEFVAVTDCGTVIHPRSLGAQVFVQDLACFIERHLEDREDPAECAICHYIAPLNRLLRPHAVRRSAPSARPTNELASRAPTPRFTGSRLRSRCDRHRSFLTG